jgi:hypothetical protein
VTDSTILAECVCEELLMLWADEDLPGRDERYADERSPDANGRRNGHDPSRPLAEQWAAT